MSALLNISLEQSLMGGWYAYATDADRPLDPPIAEGYGATAMAALADVQTRISTEPLDPEDYLDFEPLHDNDDEPIDRAAEFFLV